MAQAWKDRSEEYKRRHNERRNLRRKAQRATAKGKGERLQTWTPTEWNKARGYDPVTRTYS